MARASLAQVNGWAVLVQSTQTEAARALAGYLAWQPVTRVEFRPKAGG